ncbi:alpha/beta-hydrolase [Ophiocordyceps sinensis CO18]|uniref:Alpha/beta-hydrolase n=1 Tax=Ophiocordyceps sinensis (strain Co18 / CGMCC 3.14243) TaxID=911162 RepID=T5APT5_OPHSC|nr:alpha/beta-hydrolase [Ophiocordyceps sinensis CO18]
MTTPPSMARRRLPATPSLGPLLVATALLATCSLAVTPPAPRTGDALVLDGGAQSRVRQGQHASASDDTPLPLVIWHGLGDSFAGEGVRERAPARRNDTYRRNLARLANFVLYMFDADTTVVPRETSWFAEVNGSDVVPLRKRQLYRDDWLGLRQLDSKGRLFFRSLPGDHMDIPLQTLNDTMVDFFGPSKRTFATSGAEFEADEL